MSSILFSILNMSVYHVLISFSMLSLCILNLILLYLLQFTYILQGQLLPVHPSVVYPLFVRYQFIHIVRYLFFLCFEQSNSDIFADFKNSLISFSCAESCFIRMHVSSATCSFSSSII